MPSGKATATAVLTLLLAGIGLPAQADAAFQGEVIRIFDGDSFVVKTPDGDAVEVRLHGIDAPEKDQPYSERARAALSTLIGNAGVRIEKIEIDRFGRRLARVFRLTDDLDVNAEMVAQGHAWVYRRYTREKELYELERAARENRRGLWALPQEDILPPWQWRRQTEKEFGQKE